MANQIKFDVGFNVDKSELNTITSALKNIQAEANRASITGNLTNELKQASQAAGQLESILNQSWNSKLGQLDLSRVNNNIKSTYGSVANLKAALESSGQAGAAAYNKFASTILNTNVQLKESNKLTNKLFESFKNVFTYNISASLFNKLTGTIQEAFNYTKQLDTSLNDIRIVTGQSADNMEHFARQANEAAKQMGANTLDYTKASLIYYQQGLSDEEVAARAETTIKAANVTGQTGEEVSEQLTAVWNGYKVTAEETEAYVDKLAAVAATTAADLEELSTGMSKVASAANAMGVDFDDLNAQIATIVSVTRQAPESVGTALKTIYARLGDLSVEGGVDEFGVSLGKVSEQMQMMGVQILDQEGNLRDMSSVIAEVAEKWNGWTEAQRQAAAVAMAGKRQYNNLIALFDNWDMYTDALNTSIEAVGTLQEQQDIYMESTAAHLKQLKAEAQRTYDILFDQDVVNGFADVLRGTLSIFNNFIDAVGGGGKAFTALGVIATNVFSQQIGNQLAGFAINRQKDQSNQKAEQLKNEIATEHAARGDVVSEEVLNKEVQTRQKILSVEKGLSKEQYNNLMNLQRQIALKEEELSILTNYKKLYGDLDLEEDVSLAELKDRLNIEKDILKIEVSKSVAIKDGMNEYLIYSQNISKVKGILQEQVEYYKEIGVSANLISELENKMVHPIKNKAEIENILNQIYTEQRQKQSDQEQIVEKITQITKGKEAEENGYTRACENSKRALEQQTEQEIKQAQLRQSMQSYVQALSATVMLIQSAASFLSVLTDETKTVEERSKQLFSLIIFQLPMILFNLGAIKTAIANLTVQMGLFATAAEASKAGLIGMFKELIPAIGGLVVEFLPIIAIITAITVAVGALAVASYKAAHQIENDAKESAERVKELKNRYEELTTAVEDFKQASSEYEDSVKALEDLKKGTDEYREALEKANEQANELIEKYGLWDKVEKDEGLIKFKESTLEEVRAEQEAQKNAVERNYLGAQIFANEKELTNQANIFSREQIGAISKTYVASSSAPSTKLDYFTPEEIQQAASVIKDLNDFSLNSENGEYIQINEERLKVEESFTSNLRNHADVLIQNKKELLEYAQSMEKAREANEHYARRMVELDVAEKQTGWAKKLATTEDGIDAALEQQLLDVLTGNSNIEKLNESLEGIKVTDKDIEERGYNKLKGKNLYSEYAKNVLQYDDDDVKVTNKGIFDKEGKELETTKNVSDQEMREALTRIAMQNQLLEDWLAEEEQNIETKKPIIEALQKNQKDIEEQFGADFVNSIFNTLANGENKLNFTDLFKELSPEDVEKLKGMSSEDLMKAFGMSEEQWAELAEEGAASFQDSWKAAFEGYDISFWLEGQSEKIAGYLDNANTALSAMDKEGKLTNKELEAMTESLQSLEREYPSLAAIQDKTSTAYYNKLLQVREALEDQNKLIAQQKENLSIDEAKAIEIKVDSDGGEEKLEEKLLEICREDYEVLVSVKTDIQSDFDIAESSMNSIEEMSSKIGDDFKVAAKDIEELNNIFPGILANMQLLEDGSIQLDKDIVASAMDAAQQEMAINTAKTVDELDSQQKELEGKRDAARAIANIASQLANHETTLDEKKGEIDTALNQLKTDNSETTADNQNKDQENVADNAAIAASSMQNSFASAYDQMLKDADKWSVAMHERLAYASDINAPAPSGTPAFEKISLKADVQFVQAEEKGDLSNFEDLADVGDWKEVEDYYNNLANAYDEAINNVVGKKAELLGRENEINKELGNISKGLGADGKKKDSKSGGSKEKERKEKEKKEYREEFDRYWQLKKAIDAVDKALEKLDKRKQHTYGWELINVLKQENELLEKQKACYEQLAQAQQAEAAELRGQLGTMGVMFDASGAIVNYAEATTAALAAYNEAIQKYNAGLIDETTLGVAEKSFENFKKLLERYDTLYYTEMKETQDKLEEIRTKEIENNLKAWETELKVKIDWQDLKKGWRNFKKEMEEDFTKIFQDLRIDSKTSKKNAKNDTKKIGYDIDAIKDVNAEIDKMMAGGESSMFQSISEAQEKLKELNQDLQSHAKDLKDEYKQAWDNYLEGIDQVSEKLEQIQEQYENINEELEFQKQLIELLYGEDAYDLNASLYEGQIEANSNRLNSLVAERDTWKQLFEESGASLDNMDKWTEAQKKLYDNWQEAQKNLNDLTLEQIQLLQNQYMNTVKQIITELEKGMNNGQRLEDVRTNWERIQQSTEGVYDNVQRLYQVQTLMNKYDSSIADTKDLAAQQKLNKAKEQELEYLKDKKELTEYDIQAANLRYELALRQIALEEAQNNKTSMKLTRNEQGNWSYQYVADDEDVADKQQNVLDTWNQLYELADEAHNKNIESMMNLNESYLEQLQEIYELSLTDKELAEQRRLELDQWYQEQRQVIIDRDTQYEQDQLTATAGMLQALYDQDSIAFGEKTEKEQELAKQLSENVGNTYGDLTQAIKDNYDDIRTKANEVVTETNEEWKSSANEILNTWAKNPDSVKKMITTAYSELEAANKKYQTAVDNLAKQVGRDFGESGIKGAIDKATRSTQDLDDKTKQLCEDGERYINKLKGYVDSLKEAWDSVKGAINEAISAIEEYLQKKREAEAEAESSSGATGGGGLGGVEGNSGSGSGSGSGGGGSTNAYKPDSNNVASSRHMVRNDKTGQTWYFDSLEAAQRKASILQSRESDLTVHYSVFDTGGYTGNWNNTSGRLALLHQKELVLNKDDTENFLAGINTIRDLASVNGSIEKSIMQAVLNTASQLGNIKAGSVPNGVYNSSSDETSNVFNITAEFPNANSVDEIRQAILSLPNIASQYVNSNLR